MSGDFELTARCFALFGDPVGHSRSPAMHNAAFASLGLPHRYLAFRVLPADLADALRGAVAMGFAGINVTVPHKRAAMAQMHRVTAVATRIGAINTVEIVGGELVGHNTDGLGFEAALSELGDPGDIGCAVVLGGGGAALAVVDALRNSAKPMTVMWVSRRPTELPAVPGVRPCCYADLSALLPTVDLVVNTTVVGMSASVAEFPSQLQVERLRAGVRVIDLVYPRPHDGLLDRAQRVGAVVQDGLPMLLWQGVRALEVWLGDPLPDTVVGAMRAALGLS